MKNKFLIIIFFTLFNTSIHAENVLIQAKSIILDKKKNATIFKDDVVIQTQEKYIIKSDYAEYNKSSGLIKLRNNVRAQDDENNLVETNYAEYDENKKIFKSLGPTKILTAENYIVEGENIIIEKDKLIKSDQKSILTDKDENKIFLENFEFQSKLGIFKSIGYITIKDKSNNSYEFSQLYIDTKQKELIGTDIKAFINDKNLKFNEENDPRIFANTMEMSDQKSSYNKSVFTICKYRKNDKCPPWSIQSSRMLHDNKKKTIYYDNAVVKIYDIPIFYIPKLSHPDPTVDRRSGFLVPSLSNSKNLGTGFLVPYFWDLGNDKNFTLSNTFYDAENPLFLGEYHQVFKSSSFLADFGYTKGYKKTNASKRAGEKSHFFSEFVKNFNFLNNAEGELKISTQSTSNDKYLKLYKIESNLVDYNSGNLKNSINYTYTNEDSFFGINTSIYETLSESYNDKYEYILPEITFDKNLFSNEKFGALDFQSNLKVRNYDTNKYTNFLVNDFNWVSQDLNSKLGFKNNILGTLKNINYETKNIDLYKKDSTSELFGAIGLLSELNLKKTSKGIDHFLKPKFLLRFSPGSMRRDTDGQRLGPTEAFNLNRMNDVNNFETGASGTLGFDYKTRGNNKEFDFSIAQIINEKENKKMSSKTSLDEKLSDLVGSSNYKVGDNLSLRYNFNVDQNYKELNYSEFGTELNFNPVKVDFSYLQEDKHIGDQEYVKTQLEYKQDNNGLISFETKRDLTTDSTEFYNLSYEYFNDCLRAGLVYRREFYTDSEIEPENSLMFKITLTPFGNINTPTFNK